MPQETVTPLKLPSDELQFDGERFVPGAAVEISYHHWLRYFFALQFAQDKRVLDVASGEGYGAAFLASRALRVDGFDLNDDAVKHATRVYGDDARLSFTCSGIDRKAGKRHNDLDLFSATLTRKAGTHSRLPGQPCHLCLVPQAIRTLSFRLTRSS